MYQLLENSNGIRRNDGAYIPNDLANRDWVAYQEWLAAGNTPEKVETASLEQRRASVWRQIQSKRDSLKSGGVLVGGHWFHSDADSRIQHLGLLMMGASIPAGVKWKVLDNGLVDMTPTLAQQIFQAVAAWDMQIFGVAEAHRAAVLASENPEAYDWSGGWPAGYQSQTT